MKWNKRKKKRQMIVADSSNAIAAIKSMFESPGKQMS